MFWPKKGYFHDGRSLRTYSYVFGDFSCYADIGECEDFTLPHLFRRSPTDSYGTFFGTGLRKIHSPMGLFPTVFVQLTSDSVGLRCWTHRSPMESDGTNVT